MLPEYIHVLINPLPVYGVAGGLIGLSIAICQRSRRAIIATLLIVLVSAASAWPVYHFGIQAYNRVLSMADNDGRAWLAEHRARAEHLIWFFYGLAILSGLALVVPIKWPRSSLWLAAVVLVLGVVSLGAGGYISYAGGRVRHSEFRNESPPKISTQSATTEPGGSAGRRASQPATRVTIDLLKYTPETIEIKTGETVEWVNNDLTPHTVTAKGADNFDSGSIDPDAAWSHTFSQPGTYSYSCTFHPEMKGSVKVR